MATLSKTQKKYIDQALRRLERKFEKAAEQEKIYAEKYNIKPPQLKTPTRGEIYEKIDVSNGRNDYAQQIAKMSSVEVYQPKSWGRLAASIQGRTTAGVTTFDVDEAIKVMKASKTGLKRKEDYAEKHKRELMKSALTSKGKEGIEAMKALRPNITPLRNITYIDKDTASKVKRTRHEEEIARRKTYLSNLQTKVASVLMPESPELAAIIDAKLEELKNNGGRGSRKKLAEMKTIELSKIADDTNKENIQNTIKALEKLDLGDFTSGLASIVGYYTMASKLLELMTALGISLSDTYDGLTVEQILNDITPATPGR